MKVGSDYGEMVASGVYSSLKKRELEVQNNGAAYLTKRVGIGLGEQTERNREWNYHFEKVVTNPVRYKYEFGDMVWGKIKSYPWWPGQVFNEAFAVSDVYKTKIDGHVLVAFFGDGTYGWLDQLDIVPFDSNYFEKSKQTNARDFVNAVKEAELELRRRAALGLLCQCRNPISFRHTSVKGFFRVDVCGYVPGGLYSVRQVKIARDGFQPVVMLNFVKQLGLMPRKEFQRSLHWIKNVATVLAYRRVLFEEYDDAYVEAFGGKAPSLVNPVLALSQHHEVPIRDEIPIGDFGVHPASPVNSRMFLTWQDKVAPRASFSVPIEIDTSLGMRKISAGPVMVKDQREGGPALYEEKDGLDMLNVNHGCQGQQSLLGSSHRKASPVAKTVLEKRDEFVPNKRQSQCHQKRTDISGCGKDALSLCLAGKEPATVDKRSMLKRSGLVDVTVGWEPNCAHDLPSSLKPPKKRFQPDNFCKTGWESCSSLAEKMPLEGLKNLNRLKVLPAEKKFKGERPLMSQGTNGKDTALMVKAKPIKKPLRKIETSRTVAKPTMLAMQFPRQSKLPSVSELKAKFAPFGPFENSPRVFWKSSTCQVLFKYEYNAQVARKYAMLKKSIFGAEKILYDVQVLEVPTPDLPKPRKQSLEATCCKVPGLTSMNSNSSTDLRSKALAGKKPQADGEGFTKANPGSNLYVNFMLRREEGSMEEQLAVNNIIQRPKGDHPDVTSSCSDAIRDGTAINFKKGVVPLPPWLPHSYWISKALENNEVCKFVESCNERYLEDEKTNNQMQPADQNVDVSSAMLKLLVRCNNIMADLKSFLGHMPYNL